MRVKVLHTNSILDARDNTELVKKLSEGGYNKYATVFEYMKSYAQRAVNYFNHDIRFTSVDTFVADLVKYKHIEIIEN